MWIPSWLWFSSPKTGDALALTLSRRGSGIVIPSQIEEQPLRVLVIGGSGVHRPHLVRRLGGSGEHHIRATYRFRHPASNGKSRHRLEFGDPQALPDLLRLSRPEIMSTPRQWRTVAACERDCEGVECGQRARNPGNRATLRQYGARPVFVSTEYAFDGLSGDHPRNDTPNPNTHSGRTEHEAELAVGALADHWCIVRTSIVYGWPLQEHRNLAQWPIDRLRSGLRLSWPHGRPQDAGPRRAPGRLHREAG